jgi:cellulose synthase/poly-beta-1,6-N-acetylglucosamine synthase-like glycosyltransferase
MIIQIITFVNIAVLIYFVILSCGYIFLLVASIPDILKRYKELEHANIISIMKSHSLPPITIIIPAYNEEEFICEMVDSFLDNDYSNIFIIIVNDGSTDKTLEKLIETYDLNPVPPMIEQKIKTTATIKGYYLSKLYKNITLIDKEHTDRSDTVNIAVNACRTPLIMNVDADTLIERNAISSIVFYMLTRPDMVAAGGAVYIINGCTVEDGKIVDTKMSLNPIYAFQTCEYLRSFLFSKSGWNSLGGSLSNSGAFTAFKHASIIEVGGYAINNLAQDFEIILRLRAYKYEHRSRNVNRVGYTPAAMVWTDVPGTLKTYWGQRFNWQYAILQSLMSYKKMLFNPKYGIVGFFTYPFFLFGEALGAIVEFIAYLSLAASLYLGILNVYTAALFFILCWGFLIFLTIMTAFLNFITFNKYKRTRDLLLILFFSVIEGIGFRQFDVLCRVSATCAYFFRSFRF